MSFRINTNIDAFDAQRNLQATGMNLSKSIEKLSSGLRINRAGDDAAGLSISQKLQAQVTGLDQASRNAQDGISMVQTTEGALNEVQSILQRARELGVQGSNGTLSSDDRKAITSELGQLGSEIDRIANVTNFNGLKLLSGANAQSAVNGTIAAFAGTGSSQMTANTTGTVNTLFTASYTLTINSDTSGNVQSVTVNAGGGSTNTVNVSGTGSSNLVNIGNGVQFYFTGTVANGSTVTTSTTAGTAASASAQADTLQIGAGTSTSEQLKVSVSASGSQYIGNGSSQNGLSSTNLYAVKDFNDAVTQVTNMLSNSTSGDIQGAFRALVDSAQQALQDISGIRGTLGATQNRLEHTISNLGVAQQNLDASNSRIMDVDMASEMVNFTKENILQQAGTSILSQANQAPQSVLKLLG
ncbi:MAG: flagellin [Chloroflexi bacterium]|nr:flagellin [Chloroflexota bacterium]MBV9898669.1 flagellin [Chloroflexota bacterium]